MKYNSDEYFMTFRDVTLLLPKAVYSSERLINFYFSMEYEFHMNYTMEYE